MGDQQKKTEEENNYEESKDIFTLLSVSGINVFYRKFVVYAGRFMIS